MRDWQRDKHEFDGYSEGIRKKAGRAVFKIAVYKNGENPITAISKHSFNDAYDKLLVAIANSTGG